jgi:hypothetical protein
MESNLNVDTVFSPSKDVVVREIEGELIIVPLTYGIGDMEGELFTLNKTGQAIWQKLDGRKNLKEVIRELEQQYDAPSEVIKKDVIGLINELLKRSILIEVSKS